MKMYIIVREDLGQIYKMVQGAHALSQYSLEYPQRFKEWNNQTIVFLDVKDEMKLGDIKYKLEMCDINYSEFYEPDIGNELTSLAFLLEKEKNFIKKLNLSK